MASDDSTERTIRFHECLQKFINHVKDLESEDDPSGDGFTREFKEIRDLGIKMREENTHPAEEGKKPPNIKKNRYRDILPFDETRVVLDEIPGEEGSDYINANFIQDLHGNKAYIASQGPVQNTLYDFWRMIIQYKVKCIAMACKLIEMGKKKCEQYWPDLENEPMEFNDITITLVDEVNLADCTRRTLRAEKAGSTPLTVQQFHYTGWPDHDIPDDFDVILEMIAEMRSIKSNDHDKAPILVHCSAGCGRTGTICAIDYAWDLLKSGKMDENFSLCEIVKNMREQRQSMIQAPEQYRMAHVTVEILFQKHLEMMEDHTYGNVGEQEEETNDGSISEAGSNASSTAHSHPRKNSALNLDIAKTLQKVSGTPYHDDLLTPPIPASLQEPLKPTPVHQILPPQKQTPAPIAAVYTVEHIDPNKTPTQKSPGATNDTKVLKVDKIENIPASNAAGSIAEDRYLKKIGSKGESFEKKLSFISTNEGKSKLEAQKAMFEQTDKPNIPTKQRNSLEHIQQTSNLKEANDNIVQAPSVSSQREPLQRIHSQQTDDKKHVTVLSVGSGGVKKPPLSKTVSEPANHGKSSQGNESGSRPNLSKSLNINQDMPQSSVAPATPPSTTYSEAANSNMYSSLSNYTSAPPQNSATGKHIGSSNSGKDIMDPYSEVLNYSSGLETKPAPQRTNSDYPYSYAVGNLADRDSKPVNMPSSGAVYSFAKPFEETERDLTYASVDKPSKNKQNGMANEGVYESVNVGASQSHGPPPIPTRNYLEDEDENQGQDKSGAGDTTKVKRAQQALKNLFTGKLGTTQATSEPVTPSDIPGYKMKLGKKPKGPKIQPAFWLKKV